MRAEFNSLVRMYSTVRQVIVAGEYWLVVFTQVGGEFFRHAN
jgi:hypothetical protein